MGLTVVPVSSGNTLRQILLLQDFRPQGLACTPSFALHIGETMREQGIDPRSVGLRYGFFGAEPWTDGMRRQIEALWGIVAVDFYGLSEIIGPGVAVGVRRGAATASTSTRTTSCPRWSIRPRASRCRRARRASWS